MFHVILTQHILLVIFYYANKIKRLHIYGSVYKIFLNDQSIEMEKILVMARVKNGGSDYREAA